MQGVVTIVDYGRSNLLSVQRALEHCGTWVEYARTPAQVEAARVLVLPGVGCFADAMKVMDTKGLARAVQNKARQGTPLLGICLGMQLLFESSTEGGYAAGLGLLPGTVEPLPHNTAGGKPLRTPHIGWNALFPAKGARFGGTLLQAVRPGEEVYFVHGYQARPARAADRLANTVYGGHLVCAAVHRGNVAGTQFHPEKSGEAGLAILHAFLQGAGQITRQETMKEVIWDETGISPGAQPV